MRKRILCISLLSVLLVGVFAVSASATNYYYANVSVTADTTSLAAAAYTSSYSLASKVTLNIAYDYNGSSSKTGYTKYTANKMTFTVTTSPSNLGSSIAVAEKAISTSGTGKTATASLAGTVTNGTGGTITIQPKIGSTTIGDPITITVTIPELAAPTFSGDLSAWTTGTAKDQTINIYNAETITVESADGTASTYKIAVKPSGITKGESGSIKFTGTPQGSTTGVKVTVTAVNAAGTTEKTYYIKIKGRAPKESNFTTYPKAGSGTTLNSSDLGMALNGDVKKPIVQGGTALDKTKLVFKFGDSGTTEAKLVTTPLTITAEGLPPGLSLVQDSGSTTAAASGTAEAHIEGTPTKAGKYTVKLKATNDASAEDASGNLISTTYEKDYTMDVLFLPEITEDSLKAITWGKSYSDTITITGATSDYPITSIDIYDGTNGTKLGSSKSALPGTRNAENSTATTTYTNPPLPDGLTLTTSTKTDKKTSVITTIGTLAGTFDGADGDKFSFDKEAEKTINLRVTAGNALTAQNGYSYGVISKDVAVTLKAVKPEILNTGTIQNNLTKRKLKYHGDQLGTIATGFLVSADGPGTMTWEVTNLPAGLSISQDQKKDTTVRQLRIYGSPDVTVKNQSVKLTISNAAGKDTFALRFDIGGDSVDIFTKNHPVGPASVDVSMDKVFEARPGPIVWTSKNLPAGLKLSVDKSVSFDTKVHLVGTLKSATKVDKNGKSIYEITATNKIINKSMTVSNDYRVFDKPKITTSNLADITIDKAYTAKIAGTGGALSKDYTWDIKFRAGEKGTKAATFTPTGGSKSLSVTYDKKTNMPTIIGSIDRFPKSGDTIVPIIVTVSLTTPSAITVSKEFEFDAKGSLPKFTTSKIKDFKTGELGSADIKVTGTKPFVMSAYIEAKAAKTHLGTDGSANIPLVSKDTTANKDAITAAGGFYFVPSSDGNGKLYHKSMASGDFAFNNLPITFVVSNDMSQQNAIESKRTLTKSINVNVKGNGVQMVDASTNKVASSDVTIFVPANTAMTPYVLKISGDKPYSVDVSLKKPKNGISAVVAADGTVTISGTPVYDKAKTGEEKYTETKTQVTVTARNLSTNKKTAYKATIIGQAWPKITTLAKSRTQEVEIGKNVSVKLTAKGSKMAVSKGSNPVSLAGKKWETKNVAYQNMVWRISGDVKEFTSLGLSFDAKNGMLKGKASIPTSKDKAYSPITIHALAVNDAGTSVYGSGDITIGIKGRKFKITTKTLEFYKGSEFFDSPDRMIKTTLQSDDEYSYVKWKWSGSDYSTYGFNEAITSVNNGSMGQLGGALSSIPAKKTISMKVSADNLGQVVTGQIKFSIHDAKPSITNPGTIEIQGEETIMATDTVTFNLASEPTGDTKIKWALVGKPGSSKLTTKLESTTNSSANVKMTVAKKISGDISTWFRISAQNTTTKETDVLSVDVLIRGSNSTSALPEEKDALPEDKTELPEEELAEDETLSEDEELLQGEGIVTYGDARNESALTQAERRMLAEGGYIIAAILPEITTDESGQYDLEAVSLDEAALEGYELVWFAFPRNSEYSEDDTIAEFYDEAGAEVFAVPEGRIVVPAPWLEKDVTYAPVIAVKAPVAGEAKDSLDEAEAGDTVTEKAIEEAAESTAEGSEEAVTVSEESKHAEE